MTNMGSVLGIGGLTDQQELALLRIVKYYRKIDTMIKEYANARDRAIVKYSAFATNSDRVENYRGAWALMPAAYSSMMADKKTRVLDWLIGYLSKMFNYKFPDRREDALRQAESIFNAIVEYYRKQGVSV